MNLSADVRPSGRVANPPSSSIHALMWLTFAAGMVLIPSARGHVACASSPKGVEELPINQLQFIGTHNSYHVRAKPSRNFPSLNYSHAPLDVQLDRGVRSVELDLHDRDGVFEVFHVVKIDEGTTCRHLSEALETVRKWSDAHPGHLPISFLFELKKDGVGLDPSIRAFDAASLDRLDTLLRSVFPPARSITPDDVRGTAVTLREAVTTKGWPTLAASRGKVFFMLHDEGKLRDFYVNGHPSLRGRAMFVRSEETRDDAATLVMDNPRNSDIPRLVKAGFFIRARADGDLHTDRPGRPSRLKAAMESGAQIVSTDFPTGERQAGSGYLVEFPGGAPARVNPVNGPISLRGQTLAR
jgi:Phosphoinositide phospholipase C, Ca2+-dependent